MIINNIVLLFPKYTY